MDNFQNTNQWGNDQQPASGQQPSFGQQPLNGGQEFVNQQPVPNQQQAFVQQDNSQQQNFDQQPMNGCQGYANQQPSPNQQQAFGQQQTFYQQNQYYQQPVQFAPVAVKPRNMRPLIITLSVLLVIGLGVGIFFIINMLNKPSYEQAERNYFKRALSSGDMVAEELAENNSRIQISLKFGEGASLLGDEDNLAQLKEMLLIMDAVTEGDMSYAEFAFNYGGEEILSGKGWADIKNKLMVMLIPEFSETIYLDYSSSLNDFADSLSEAMTTRYEQEQQEQIDELMEQLQPVLDRVAEKYFQLFGGAEISGNDSKTVNNITYKYDVIEIYFTYEKLIALLKEALVAIKESPALIESLAKISGTDISEISSGIDQAISSLDAAPEDTTYESMKDESLFTMKVYMSGGEIIGRNISVMGVVTLEIFDGKQGNNYAQVVDFSMPLNDIYVNVTNAGSVSGELYTGSLTGSLAVSSMEKYEADITYTGFGVNNGNICGEALLNVPSASFTASLSGDSNGNATMDMAMQGQNIVTLSITTSPSQISMVPAPTIDSSNSIDITSTDPDALNSPLVEEYKSAVVKWAKSIMERFPELAGNVAISPYDTNENEFNYFEY